MLVKGKVFGIIANLVIVKIYGDVAQNEVCHIHINDIRLLAEVIKVIDDKAYVQVYESTVGLRVGAEVYFSGHLIEVTLGPGLLSRNYDGLQNDLNKRDGLFLKRGEHVDPLDYNKLWTYNPIAKKGDFVSAGDWIAEVKENWISHKIMVPFSLSDRWVIKDIVNSGEYSISDTVAILANKDGKEVNITMAQNWPIKKAIKAYSEKIRPYRLMETGIRMIDMINPMAEGGTGFIPGPFGCGKTVLQHSLSKQANADMIIFVACGERANEIVDIFYKLPNLDDPRTNRKLSERTIVICNTSNMPVAAREASVYTGMTIAEYYRSMGLKVLLLADSTSRWAQALREMSNRMEEIPGADAFPVDLSTIISNFYSRAGIVLLNNKMTGSITLIATVSPAGGNLKEPVTEATKKATKCYYALSQDRADSKRYPALDYTESYSKYLEYKEIRDFLYFNISHLWLAGVEHLKNVLVRGREAYDQINILGDDGVPLDYHIRFWRSELIDFIILQQDAYDEQDSSTPIERQKYMLNLVVDLCKTNFTFDKFEEVRIFFKRLINQLKQMNYSIFKSEGFYVYERELDNIVLERKLT